MGHVKEEIEEIGGKKIPVSKSSGMLNNYDLLLQVTDHADSMPSSRKR